MQPAFGLYTHIWANAFRSVLLIVGLFALIYCLAFGYTMIRTAVFDGGSFGYIVDHSARSVLAITPHITAAALTWIVIGYYFNKWIVGAVTGARPVTRKDEPELYNFLENLCVSRGMPMPTLSIVETPELNAFASGLSEKQYTVAVTRGLIEHLDDDEIEAVLAHELTHIRNHDVRLMVIAVVIVGMIAMCIEIMLRYVFYSSGNRNAGRGSNGALPAILVGIAIIIGVWFLSRLLNFALSRRREFMADAGAVELTKNPDAMISALRKIEGHSDVEAMPTGMMEMCIDNPRSDFTSWFATHPSIDDRVAALKKFAGGRDRAPGRVAARRRIAQRSSGQGAAPRDNPWTDGRNQASVDAPTAAKSGPNPWSVEDLVVIGSVLEAEAEADRPGAKRRPRRPAPAPDPKPAPDPPPAPDHAPWTAGNMKSTPTAGFAPKHHAQRPTNAVDQVRRAPSQAAQPQPQPPPQPQPQPQEPTAASAARPSPTPAGTPSPPSRPAKLKRALQRTEPQGFGKRGSQSTRGFGKRSAKITRKAKAPTVSN